MKLGICTGFDNLKQAAAIGFDYVECNLSSLAAMPEEEFQKLADGKADFPIPVTKSNVFLPGNLKVTGPDYNEQALREYLDRALFRAHTLGIEICVFGSGGARRVPEDWPHYKAWQQIGDFLKLVEEYAAKYDIQVAIEPLRRTECNILNFVSEALAVSALTELPHIGVLGDTFHMLSGGEPWTAMGDAGDKLWHVHISHELEDLSSRVFPLENDGTDYDGIFQVLHDMNYAGDISVEAGCSDFAKDGAQAVKVLRKYINM